MNAPGPRFRGVVFDLDGTLLDSMPLVLEGLAAAVTPFRPRPGLDEVMGSLGGPSEACLLRLLGGPRNVPAALATYVRFFEDHDETTRLFDGARELLRDLSSAGLPVGIWTGRERSMAATKLRALGLDGHFDVVICGDDLPSHKPDPEGLRRILQRWGLRPEQIVFVGDSDQDLEAARIAEVAMVAIRHGREIAPDLLRHPLAVADAPGEAFAWLRGALLAG